jgi:hypothetical protein
MKEVEFFKSSDLSLISTLQIYGYQIEAMDRSNEGKIIFLIKRDKELDDLIQAFWSRSLRVCPLTYFESLKATKARIYQ